jgi:hypothetical protein
MFFYFTLLLLSSITAFCYTFSKDISAGYIFKTLTFLLLFVPSALRYGIGYDYFGYERYFNEIKLGRDVVIDIGFLYFYRLINYFGGSFQFQLLAGIMSLLTIGFFLNAFPKKIFYLCVPIFVMFLYLWVYTTIRQIFVSSLVFFAYNKFFLKKKYISFLFLLLTCKKCMK